MPMTPLDSPRLIADIGGTYARFAVETTLGRFEHAASLRCADHADFHAAVTAYLAGQPCTGIRHAAVAIAYPVEGDQVRMTNYHWQFSIEQMRERLGLQTLVVVNDFTALAMAVPRLSDQGRRQVGGGQPREPSVIGVLGAGSGLGVSGLIPADDGWVALGTEGGHASFAPRDELELMILRFAWRQFSHVSFERLLSGPGLELIHRALLERDGVADPGLPAPEITRRCLDGSDARCTQAIAVFCGLLGTAAGNLAVTLGAQGGVYIGGGIVPRLGAHFDRSPFRQRFEDKGRFTDYLRAIPTYVITVDQATFVGASAILQAQLRSLDDAPGSALLEQIRRGLPSLSPAERRVADHVLAHPRAAVADPVADIARAAGVSQPTVIRFCRSLGCQGLSDFKLRLASGLTGTVPVTHTQVTGQDSMVEVGAKVLGNTASAILQVRDQLNRATMDRVIALLDGASHIEFHAFGHYGVVAQDAQFKFLRLGLSCVAHTDPRLQLLAAGAVRPNDLVVINSGGGQVPELLAVADKARERGAVVVAITASQSPLARRVDLALIVDHREDVATQLPMVSRILHLLVIDILAVGVAMRRSVVPAPAIDESSADWDHADAGPGLAAAPRRRPAIPGVTTSVPLSQLSSHSN
jgi:glucokinase